MKKLTYILVAAIAFTAYSCGDMSNNTNENNHQNADSIGVPSNDPGNPDATGAPIKNVYDTDSMTSTSGPDNATPKSESMDSTRSLQP